MRSPRPGGARCHRREGAPRGSVGACLRGESIKRAVRRNGRADGADAEGEGDARTIDWSGDYWRGEKNPANIGTSETGGVFFTLPVFRGRSRSPASHSSNLAVLTIALPPLDSTWREALQLEQVSERGRVATATTPTWPHGQTTLAIMELHQKSPGRTGAKVCVDGVGKKGNPPPRGDPSTPVATV